MRNATQENKETDTNKPVPFNLPASIEISKAPVIQIDAKIKKDKENWYYLPEWWMVMFSLILAIITAALAAYTAKLYHATVNLGQEAKNTSERQAIEVAQSLIIAKESAEAAKKSADALPTIERAYLFVERILWSKAEQGIRLGINFRLVNSGKTPAIINRISIGLTDNMDCTIEPISKKVHSPKKNIIPASTSTDESIPFDWDVWTEEDWNAKQGATKFEISFLRCCGVIEYSDIFGKEHHTGFCWHHDQESVVNGLTFRQCNNIEKNYYT